ncbi:MAG: IS1634 family transposase [Thermoplasmata archaeon]
MSYTRVKPQGDRFYLCEYESYWDPEMHRSRQRFLRYLGPCDKDGKPLAPPTHRIDHVHSVFEVGRLALFFAAARDLKVVETIEVALGCNRAEAELVLDLALNQVVLRRPLYHLADWVRRSPLMAWQELDPSQVTHEAYQEALMRLCRPLSSEYDNAGLFLQERLNTEWRRGSREPAAVYYDITKQTYYGTECPNAAIGHDADRNLANVVGFGLVVSRDHHHPVLCRPLLGSKNDTLSVHETVEQLKGFGYEHLTLVMDRGMVSEANLKVVTDAGYEQLGIVRGWNEEAWRYITRWPRETLEQPRFVVDRGSGAAAYCRSWVAPLYGRKRMRVTVVENPRRTTEEKESRDLAIMTLEKGHPSAERLRQIRKVLGRDVAETSRGRRGFVVNEKVLKGEEPGLGRFLLFSTDLSLEAEEMFELYFRRDSVEKAFETMKGELSLGPIRYRRVDRLDAYSTVVYVAYLLWSWVERKLKEEWPKAPAEVRKKYPSMSLPAALELLEGVSWVKFGAGKSIREWANRLTHVQEAILAPLGADKLLPVAYVG